MPQLDTINWFYIIGMLIVFLCFGLVLYVKYFFYNWKKVLILKEFLLLFCKNIENTFFEQLSSILKTMFLFFKNQVFLFKMVSRKFSLYENKCNIFHFRVTAPYFQQLKKK